MSRSSSARSRQRDGAWALPALVLTATLPVLAGTALAAALPDVAAGLQTSAAAAVSIVTVYLATQALAQPFTGILADRMCPQRSVSRGLWVLATGSLLAALSPTMGVLLAARCVEALGAALILPGVHAQLAADARRTGSRFAWLTAIGNITAAAGPILGGLVTAHAGWRGVFAAAAMLTAATAVMLSRVNAQTRSPQSPRARLPMRRMFADRRCAAAAGLNALDNLALQALLIGVPFAAAGVSRLSAAAALAALTLAGALAAPLGGRIADRAGHVATARAGFAVAAAALLVLYLAGPRFDASGVLALLAIAGFGLGLEFPSVQAMPLALAPRGSRATAAGLAATARQLGSLSGAALVSAVAMTDPAAVLLVGGAAAAIAGALTGLAGRPARPAVWPQTVFAAAAFRWRAAQRARTSSLPV